LRAHGVSERCPNFREPLPPGPEKVHGQTICYLLRAQQIQNNDNEEAASLYKKAGILFQQVVNEDPSLAKSYEALGETLMEQSDIAGAVAACKRAIAIKPESAISHNMIGYALIKQDNIADSVDAFKTAVVPSNQIAY
jgi:tetratricopeptide (TPR) repeat protein